MTQVHANELPIIDAAPEGGPERGSPDRRSRWGGAAALVAIVGLGYVVTRDGSPAEPPTTSVAPTTVPAVALPSVSGELLDGTPFVVVESEPGLLCAEIGGSETCHRDGVRSSGPGLVADDLVFGYLPPGSRAATVRYRSIRPSAEGVEIEPDARFFAIPLQDDDPYRLQYRNDDFDVEREVPLVAPTDEPSQSPADASRDGVPDDIAELSFDDRITVLAEWPAFAEGPLVWSVPGDGLADQRLWRELARLDATGTRIVSTLPLPGVRLDTQLVRADALYFLGAFLGTEAEPVDRPETVLVRIDRTTDESLIRRFPDTEVGPFDTNELGAVSGVLQLELVDGTSVRVDGTTLSLIE